MDDSVQKEKCFELLCAVKHICEENKIWYSLACGTLLGAVRHQGFIPWDTDVDVFIMLPDKERFRQAFMRSAPKGIELDNFDIQPHNTHSHDQMRFSQIDDLQVHLDIYFLVGAPTEYEKQKKFIRKCYVLDHIIRSKHNKIKDCKKKNRPLVFCAQIIDYCFPDCILKKIIKSLETEFDYEEAEYVTYISNDGSVGECLPKNLLQELIDGEFNGERFMIPKAYDTVLTRTYGDYMTPRRY